MLRFLAGMEVRRERSVERSRCAGSLTACRPGCGLAAEIAGLRAELDGERELRRRMELRLAEFGRRLGMDSSDSGTPSSEERIEAKEGQAGQAAVGAGVPEGPQARRAGRSPGERAGQGPGAGRAEGRAAAG
jgi:hypothetical protein